MPAVRSRPLISILALACVALAGLAVSASAKSGLTSYPTSIFISEKFPAFHGRLHSSNKFCIAERPVKVYRETPGPDKLLGSERSEGDGYWQVPIGRKLTSGVYYSRAPRYGSAALGIACGPATSKVAVVD
ncbi:MAG TPA: hypothetical protein VII45_05740 [Solirubrobacterales bacterium]